MEKVVVARALPTPGDPAGVTALTLPANARFLCANFDNLGQIGVWFEVIRHMATTETRRFQVVPSTVPVPGSAQYLGSAHVVLDHRHMQTMHVYELGDDVP